MTTDRARKEAYDRLYRMSDPNTIDGDVFGTVPAKSSDLACVVCGLRADRLQFFDRFVDVQTGLLYCEHPFGIPDAQNQNRRADATAALLAKVADTSHA